MIMEFRETEQEITKLHVLELNKATVTTFVVSHFSEDGFNFR